MRILITNDDGINALALPYLVRWAQRLGEVTVVAPKYEQSGKSQAIDFFRAVEIVRADIGADCEAWSMDSTPADCVRFGITGLKRQYDIVLSGINRGYNLGHDIAYSGTVGAIFEAARLGVCAVALSTDVDGFEHALPELDAVYEYILKNRLFDHAHLLNINFPTEKSRGIRITQQGGMFYSDEFVCRSDGKYIQVGDPVRRDGNDPHVDINAVADGFISITPLTEVRTDEVAFEKLKCI